MDSPEEEKGVQNLIKLFEKKKDNQDNDLFQYKSLPRNFGRSRRDTKPSRKENSAIPDYRTTHTKQQKTKDCGIEVDTDVTLRNNASPRQGGGSNTKSLLSQGSVEDKIPEGNGQDPKTFILEEDTNKSVSLETGEQQQGTNVFKQAVSQDHLAFEQDMSTVMAKGAKASQNGIYFSAPDIDSKGVIDHYKETKIGFDKALEDSQNSSEKNSESTGEVHSMSDRPVVLETGDDYATDTDDTVFLQSEYTRGQREAAQTLNQNEGQALNKATDTTLKRSLSDSCRTDIKFRDETIAKSLASIPTHSGGISQGILGLRDWMRGPSKSEGNDQGNPTRKNDQEEEELPKSLCRNLSHSLPKTFKYHYDKMKSTAEKLLSNIKENQDSRQQKVNYATSGTSTPHSFSKLTLHRALVFISKRVMASQKSLESLHRTIMDPFWQQAAETSVLHCLLDYTDEQKVHAWLVEWEDLCRFGDDVERLQGLKLKMKQLGLGDKDFADLDNIVSEDLNGRKALSKELKTKDLVQLSLKLSSDEFKTLGLMLGLELADLKCIEQDNLRNSKDAILEMLEKWRQKTSGNVHQLVQALKSIGRRDLVDIVRPFCEIRSSKEIFV